MGETGTATGPQVTGRRVARVFVSLVAAAGLAYLLLLSGLLALIKCGDTCGGHDTEHWRWTAQLVLAAVASVLGLAALALGFTSRTRAYRALLAVSVACVLSWLVWVVGLGEF